jgi:hypothetical protein
MDVKNAIKMLQDYPEDYELVFSDYTVVVMPELEEQYIVISDDPITGIIESEDTKEIRFCTRRSERFMQSEEVAEFTLLQ